MSCKMLNCREVTYINYNINDISGEISFLAISLTFKNNFAKYIEIPRLEIH